MDKSKQKWIQQIEQSLDPVNAVPPLPSDFRRDLKLKLHQRNKSGVKLSKVIIFLAAASFAVLIMTNIWLYNDYKNNALTNHHYDELEILVTSYQLITPTMANNQNL